jgi:shikimate dehydrogenase
MPEPKKILGLIGRNVGYSWSPLIHNTAFSALGLSYYYTIFDIAEPGLIGDALKGCRALGLSGFNVTIPYKKTVVPFLDELAPEAQAVQAVNTIVHQNGKLTGHNTDIEGFAAPLLPFAERIAGTPVCIFGSGGAAMAAIEAFRLFFRPAGIMLFVREPEKAGAILSGYEHRGIVTTGTLNDIETAEGSRLFRECSVVVNATPVGTGCRHRHSADSIVPLDRDLMHHGQIVYDMVYNPIDTPLLGAAEQAGAKTISGIEMLIGQAARSFQIWTGRTMPVETVRNVLLQEIRSVS